MEPAEARITHCLPGRMRLRIPERRGEVEYFAKVARAFECSKRVRAVEVNPVSASVLVSFEGDELVLDELEALSPLLRVRDIKEASRSLLADVVDALGRSRGRLGRVTRGKLDAESLAFLGYAFVGLYQISRGHAMPAGLTLLHYALGLIETQRERQGVFPVRAQRGGPDKLR